VTERLAEINARIAGIRQLGAVVNALRGIAGARTQQAKAALAAVDIYEAAIAEAIARAMALQPTQAEDGAPRPNRPALVLFLAEQGFAGAFSEHVLAAAGTDLSRTTLFLIGSRGQTVAAARGMSGWQAAMPASPAGIPRLADQIAEALYTRIAQGRIGRLDVLFSQGRAAGATVVRQRLFPLSPTDFKATAMQPPLLNLAPEQLLDELTANYIHSRLCRAALHAFAAENEARMTLMASARKQAERQLTALEAVGRQVRQEEITAEIIELAAGASVSHETG
jgi:F-type H+-transporting ATPase subunit gamma